MAKVQVILPKGRIVDGEITSQHNFPTREPVLKVDGKSYLGLEAVNQGLLMYPIDDAVIDAWLNTFTVMEDISTTRRKGNP